MPGSSSTSRRWLAPVLLAFLLGVSPAATAENFVDDAQIKSQLRSSLVSLLDDTDVPAGEAIRKQLRGSLPASTELTLPKAPWRDADPGRGVYDRLSAPTVVVGHIYKCDRCDDWHVGHASGVFLSDDGLLLTNHHVLSGQRARVFGAVTRDGDFFPVRRVIHASKSHDLALVELAGVKDAPFVSLSIDVSVGDSVYSVSHPDSHFFTFGQGRVTRFYLTPKNKVPRMQVNLDFAVGSSGAGIFDEQGRLGGLITSTKSVYYTGNEGKDRNLQMVIRSVVPLSSIQTFLGEAGVIPLEQEAGKEKPPAKPDSAGP